MRAACDPRSGGRRKQRPWTVSCIYSKKYLYGEREVVRAHFQIKKLCSHIHCTIYVHFPAIENPLDYHNSLSSAMDSTSEEHQCMLCGSPFNLPQLSSSSPKASSSLASLDKIMAEYGTEDSESEDSESEDSESEDSEDVENRFFIHGYCWRLFEYLDLSKERLLESSKPMWEGPSTSFFSPTIYDLALGCRILLGSSETGFAALIASLSKVPELLHEVLGYLPDCYLRSTIAVLAFGTIMRPIPSKDAAQESEQKDRANTGEKIKDLIRTIQISTTISAWTIGAYLTDL